MLPEKIEIEDEVPWVPRGQKVRPWITGWLMSLSIRWQSPSVLNRRAEYSLERHVTCLGYSRSFHNSTKSSLLGPEEGGFDDDGVRTVAVKPRRDKRMDVATIYIPIVFEAWWQTQDSHRVLFYERLLENYCFVLFTNRAPPQMSDDRPDMIQRALFVTTRAAWRWNKMLLARENVDSPLAAMALATEHNALWASGCQPPSVENGTGSRLNPVRDACSMPEYLETLAVYAAFNRFNGFADSSRILAWLRGWEIVSSKSSVPPRLPNARISVLSLWRPTSVSSTTGWRAAFARSLANSFTCASCRRILWGHSLSGGLDGPEFPDAPIPSPVAGYVKFISKTFWLRCAWQFLLELCNFQTIPHHSLSLCFSVMALFWLRGMGYVSSQDAWPMHNLELPQSIPKS